MELKEFVKKVIIDLDSALSEANSETNRQVWFRGVKEQRTSLEFDIAVTAEESSKGEAGGEIKVLGIGQMGAKGLIESKNSMVSRVSFGVDIAKLTKSEQKIINDGDRRQRIIDRIKKI